MTDASEAPPTRSAPQQPSRAQRKAKAIQYVAALDGLRAIAALGVVIIHTESEANASITTYVITGTITGPFFMLFFAISGFVLYRGWARKNLAIGDPKAPAAARRGTADGGADGRAGKFLLRRLIRIYPLYWVVATAALLVSDNTDGHSLMDIIQVYLLLPFPNLDALVDLGLGIVVWTLIIDILFYVYVAIHGPVMHAVVGKLHRRWTPFQIETTVLLAMSAVILVTALFVPAPLSALVCLPLGMWFAVIEGQQDRLGHQLPGVRAMVNAWPLWIFLYVTLAPIMDMIAISAAEDYGSFLSSMPGIHMLLVLVGFLLLINVLWGPKHWPLPRLLSSRFMRQAGLLTYGTYLWHPVILIVLGQRFPDGSMLLYQSVTIVGSIALAFVTYTLVERPLARVRVGMRAPEPATKAA